LIFENRTRPELEDRIAKATSFDACRAAEMDKRALLLSTFFKGIVHCPDHEFIPELSLDFTPLSDKPHVRIKISS
jgi:hypothetical protein